MSTLHEVTGGEHHGRIITTGTGTTQAICDTDGCGWNGRKLKDQAKALESWEAHAAKVAVRFGVERIDGANGHRYKIDGVRVDGVTTLIGGGLPKPKLVAWAAREVAEYVAANLDKVDEWRAMSEEQLVVMLKTIPDQVRDAAGKRGTDVHDYAERLVVGEEVEYEEHLAGHVMAYLKFLDEWQVEPVLVERWVGSRSFRYGGTTDLVAWVTTPWEITVEDCPWLTEPIPAGTRLLVVFDPKTSRSGLWPEVAYQLSAYWNADFYMDGDIEVPMESLGIQHAAAVHVRADGYDVHFVDAGPDTYTTFQHIATVARRAKNGKNLIGKAIQQ